MSDAAGAGARVGLDPRPGPPALEVRAVTCRFGGVTALDRCSLSIAAGSITGIVGPNGAGKTTLFNTIAGLVRPAAGQVLLDGQDITALPPHHRYRRGLLRSFQIAHDFARLTVRENLMVAGRDQLGEGLLAALARPRSVRDQEAALTRRATRVLEQVALSAVADLPAGALSGGQKKLLELGRVLMADGRVILLDEIAAGVNRSLLRDLARLIRSLNQDHGLTLCLIEHDMEFIAALCDPVIVMAEGQVLTQGTMAALRQDPRVVDAYFGAGPARTPGEVTAEDG